MVDDEDYERLNQYKWSEDGNGYAQRRCVVNGRASVTQMHRDIIDAPEGMVRAHIDGNGLNNTRANIRICMQQENTFNRAASKNNTSGYKCVTLHNQTGRWKSYIKVNYKQISLGCYATREEAASAYNYAAIDHYGKFARLNILPDGISFTREHLATERDAYRCLQKTPEYREERRQQVIRQWQRRKEKGPGSA